MDNKPFFSIITATFNCGKTLRKTLNSIKGQQECSFEHIVIDGGSTDSTIGLLKEFKGTYGLYWLSEPDSGISQALNKGLCLARGRYVLVVHGDDRLLPRKLELEFKTYKNNPQARCVYSQVFYVDVSGRRTGILRYTGKHKNKGYTFKDVATKIGKEPAYQLMERAILDEIGLFDEYLEIYEDWDFAIRLAKHFKCAYCPTPLYEYRQYEGGLSNSSKDTYLRSVKNVYRNILPLLSDIPGKESRAIKRELTGIIYGFDASKQLEAGKRLEAIKCFVKAIISGAKNPYLFELGIMVFSPKKVTAGLRIVKRKIFLY